MATLASPEKNGDASPLYVSPAAIKFKASTLAVMKGTYKRRAIVRCIEHLPVPYVVEIPPSSRFTITTTNRKEGDPDEWRRGIIDCGMDGIPLVISYEHPTSGEGDYIYDNFQTVVYIHTPNHTLPVFIKAVRNDQEEAFCPSRLPTPVRPAHSDFPQVRLVSATTSLIAGFHDEDSIEFSPTSKARTWLEGKHGEGDFETDLPEYPTSPVESPGRREENEASKFDNDELEFYSKLMGGEKDDGDSTGQNQAFPNIQGPRKKKSVAIVPTEEKTVETFEDAKEMIKRMRMGRTSSVRPLQSTLAGTGSSIVARAGESSRLLPSRGVGDRKLGSGNEKHTKDEINFYNNYIVRKEQEVERKKLFSNPYDASSQRERAKKIDAKIAKDYPQLAKTKRWNDGMNGKIKPKAQKRFTHTRIVLSSSSDEGEASQEEEDEEGEEADSSRGDLNSSVDSRVSDQQLSTAMSATNGLPGRETGDVLFSEHYAEEHKKRLLTWSSDDDSDDDIVGGGSVVRGGGTRDGPTQRVNMSADEHQFYKTITSMSDVLSPRSAYENSPRHDDASRFSQTVGGGAITGEEDDAAEKELDQASQAEYEERLRAALSDVTLGQASRTRGPKRGSSRPRLKSEGRKRKPRRHVPKTENILNVKDWL